MKKFTTVLLALLAATLFAPAASAQTEAAGSGVNWVAISASFGIAIAAAFCGIAQSRVAGAACEGMGRNPGAADAIRLAMILGLVFIETLVLFTFVMILLRT